MFSLFLVIRKWQTEKTDSRVCERKTREKCIEKHGECIDGRVGKETATQDCVPCKKCDVFEKKKDDKPFI